MLQILDGIRGRPRQSDLSFRTLEVSCFNNTWRPAVAEAASRPDVPNNLIWVPRSSPILARAGVFVARTKEAGLPFMISL
jgi:hypothetical protein